MENSNHHISRAETIGIAIILISLVLIIYFKARSISQENTIFRDVPEQAVRK